MKKKTKYITAAIVFVLLSLCNIFVSAIFHKMLIKDNQWLTFAPFIETCKLVFSNMGARSIFLAFEVFIVLGLIAAQLSRTSTYKSDMVKISKNIEIPQRAGQNQYGSARFYRDDELDTVFTEIKINKQDSYIQEPMKHGYDDLEFMKKE